MTESQGIPIRAELRPSVLKSWTLAARPRTLPAAVGPVIVGAGMAIGDGVFQWLPALAALAGSLLLQIGSNFANDYFDHFKGTDTPDRVGPTRVTASGILSPAQMRLGMVVVFGLATLVGLYLIWVGGWPILATGLAAILAALAYSGGPLPYGYYGMGELFVFLFFGLAAVVGTYWVQALAAPAHVWIAAIPVGALIMGILVVNNFRDRQTDSRSGKRTLAVLLGVRGTQMEFDLLLIAAYLTSAVLAVTRSPWMALPWLTVPIALRLAHGLRTKSGPELNLTLAGMARLSLVFSALLAVGAALG